MNSCPKFHSHTRIKRDSNSLPGVFFCLHLNYDQKKMLLGNTRAHGTVQEAHKKHCSAELGQQLNQIISENFPNSQGNVLTRTSVKQVDLK